MVYEARQRFGRQDSAARHTTAEDPFEDAQERERGVEGLIDEGRQRDEGAQPTRVEGSSTDKFFRNLSEHCSAQTRRK